MLLVGMKTSPTILKSCLTYSKVEDTHIVFVEHQTEKKFKWMDERRVCSHRGILYSTEKKSNYNYTKEYWISEPFSWMEKEYKRIQTVWFHLCEVQTISNDASLSGKLQRKARMVLP